MTANQINALITTAPEMLRQHLRGLTTRQRVSVAVKYRTGEGAHHGAGGDPLRAA